MHHFLRHVLMALAVTLPLPALGAGDNCAMFGRLKMLQDVYAALLANPNAPRATEVALYAEALSKSFAAEAPESARAQVLELAEFAADIRSSGRGISLSLEQRNHHLDNTEHLGSIARAYDCPDPEERPRAIQAGTDRQSDWASSRPTGRLRALDVDAAPSLTEEFNELFTARRLLVALGALTLFALAWLLSLLASELNFRPLKSILDAAARNARLRNLAPRLLRNRRRARHHILGRFFDVFSDETGTTKRVKVADLSIYGAKLAWPGPPANGSQLGINLDGVMRRARVVWINPHFCGVEFDDPLDEAQLKMILARPADEDAVSGELEMF